MTRGATTFSGIPAAAHCGLAATFRQQLNACLALPYRSTGALPMVRSIAAAVAARSSAPRQAARRTAATPGVERRGRKGRRRPLEIEGRRAASSAGEKTAALFSRRRADGGGEPEPESTSLSPPCNRDRGSSRSQAMRAARSLTPRTPPATGDVAFVWRARPLVPAWGTLRRLSRSGPT